MTETRSEKYVRKGKGALYLLLLLALYLLMLPALFCFLCLILKHENPNAHHHALVIGLVLWGVVMIGWILFRRFLPAKGLFVKHVMMINLLSWGLPVLPLVFAVVCYAARALGLEIDLPEPSGSRHDWDWD